MASPFCRQNTDPGCLFYQPSANRIFSPTCALPAWSDHPPEKVFAKAPAGSGSRENRSGLSRCREKLVACNLWLVTFYNLKLEICLELGAWSFAYARVVSRSNVIRSLFERPIKKRAEFNMLVAHHIRIRCPTSAVFGNHIIHHFLFIFP